MMLCSTIIELFAFITVAIAVNNNIQNDDELGAANIPRVGHAYSNEAIQVEAINGIASTVPAESKTISTRSVEKSDSIHAFSRVPAAERIAASENAKLTRRAVVSDIKASMAVKREHKCELYCHGACAEAPINYSLSAPNKRGTNIIHNIGKPEGNNSSTSITPVEVYEGAGATYSVSLLVLAMVPLMNIL